MNIGLPLLNEGSAHRNLNVERPARPKPQDPPEPLGPPGTDTPPEPHPYSDAFDTHGHQTDKRLNETGDGPNGRGVDEPANSEFDSVVPVGDESQTPKSDTGGELVSFDQGETVSVSTEGLLDPARNTPLGAPTTRVREDWRTPPGGQVQPQHHADAPASVAGVIEPKIAVADPEPSPEDAVKPEREVPRADGRATTHDGQHRPRLVNFGAPSAGQSTEPVVGPPNQSGLERITEQMTPVREPAKAQVTTDSNQTNVLPAEAAKVAPAATRAAELDHAIRLNQGASTVTTAAPLVAGVMEGGSSQSGSNTSWMTSGGAAQPTEFARVDDQHTTARVVRGLSAMVSQRGGTMMMRLDPPELGALQVKMTVMNGVVNAQMLATSEQGARILDRNMGSLRAALEQQGLTVEKLSVTTNQQSNSSDLHGNSQQREGDSQREQDAAGRESRGRRGFSRSGNDAQQSFEDAKHAAQEEAA